MINMQLQVPKNLAGASLLKAHNWIRSNVAKTNPGGNMDYRIRDIGGRMLTLSDIVNNPNVTEIEVTQIDGVRQNPSLPSMISEPEPIYPTPQRLGNYASTLLPGDIDPALVKRLVEQEGAFGAVQTLTILLYRRKDFNSMDPKIAQLLQSYSNAVDELAPARKNPAVRSPFTVSAHERDSVYNTERAIQEYLQDAFDGVTAHQADTVIEGARMPARFGLTKRDVEKFVRDVLGPFLVAASANRGLLRTMNELHHNTISKDREGYNALLYVLPTKAQDFYEGRKVGLVAHPRFIYPKYAEKSLKASQVKKMMKYAKKYPKAPFTMKTMDSVAEPFGYKILQSIPLLSIWTDIIPTAHQRNIMKRDSTFMKEDIVKALMFDPTKSLLKKPPVYIAQDIGGFYPSPPPKWPREVVYAIMDTMLENLPHIIDVNDPQNNYRNKITAALVTPISGTTPSDEDYVTIGASQGKAEQMKWGDLNAGLNNMGDQQNENATRIKSIYDDDSGINPATLLGKNTIIGEALESRPSQIKIDADVGKSIIELLFEINQTAREKYGYTMTGDEHTFALAMLDMSFRLLNQSTPGGFFATAPTNRSVRKELKGLFSRQDATRAEALMKKMEEVNLDASEETLYTYLIYSKLLDDMEQEARTEYATLTTEIEKSKYLKEATVELDAFKNDVEKQFDNTPLTLMINEKINEVRAIIRRDMI